MRWPQKTSGGPLLPTEAVLVPREVGLSALASGDDAGTAGGHDCSKPAGASVLSRTERLSGEASHGRHRPTCLFFLRLWKIGAFIQPV